MKQAYMIYTAACLLLISGCVSGREARRADLLEKQTGALRGSLEEVSQENRRLTQQLQQANARVHELQSFVDQRDFLLKQQQQIIERMEKEQEKCEALSESSGL